MVKTIKSTKELISLLSNPKSVLSQSYDMFPGSFRKELIESCLERSLIFPCRSKLGFTPKAVLQETHNCIAQNYSNDSREGERLHYGKDLDEITGETTKGVWFIKNSEDHKAGNKIYFANQAHLYGIPVLEYTIRSKGNSDTELPSFPLFIQEQNNSGGRGNHIINSERELHQLGIDEFIASQYFKPSDIEISASFFGWMNQGRLSVDYLVSQEVKDGIYSGSSSPLSLTREDKKQLRFAFSGIQDYLRAEGYEGPAGFDLMKINGRWNVMDPNLRLTASFYPFFIAESFGHHYWKTIEIDTEALDQEYVSKALKQIDTVGSHVMPYFMQDNFFMFVYVGNNDKEKLENMSKKIKRLNP